MPSFIEHCDISDREDTVPKSVVACVVQLSQHSARSALTPALPVPPTASRPAMASSRSSPFDFDANGELVNEIDVGLSPGLPVQVLAKARPPSGLTPLSNRHPRSPPRVEGEPPPQGGRWVARWGEGTKRAVALGVRESASQPSIASFLNSSNYQSVPSQHQALPPHRPASCCDQASN